MLNIFKICWILFWKFFENFLRIFWNFFWKSVPPEKSPGYAHACLWLQADLRPFDTILNFNDGSSAFARNCVFIINVIPEVSGGTCWCSIVTVPWLITVLKVIEMKVLYHLLGEMIVELCRMSEMPLMISWFCAQERNWLLMMGNSEWTLRALPCANDGYLTTRVNDHVCLAKPRAWLNWFNEKTA